MFPFDRPKDYGEMLNKIGIFTFLVALGLTWFIGDQVPSIGAVLNSRLTTFDVGSLHVPILYVVPAAAIALVARIIRLHDKLSDLFRIRQRFDITKILIPLCVAAGLSVTNELLIKLKQNRDTVMERTFYRYASFEDPKISKALVLGAVEVWTWYWVILESAILCFVAAGVLFFNQNYHQGSAVLGASVGLILIFSSCFYVCGKRAKDQVTEIMADGDRATSIRVELSRTA